MHNPLSQNASSTALDIIAKHAQEGAQLRTVFFEQAATTLDATAKRLAIAMAKGHKLLLAGNGGSAADAQHLAGEFVNRFLIERPPLPAIALTVDSSVLTAIANDVGAEWIFAKQVQALGNVGDIFLAISTSGNSPNIVQAVKIAKEQGLYCIGFTGAGGGTMANLCDVLFAIPHTSTPLVQEIHAALGHLLCQLTDYYLFENVAAINHELQTV